MQKSVKHIWIWIIILLAVFVSISFFLNSSKPTEYPPYLSTSPSPSGVKAFYTYLKEESIPVERLKKSPGSLDHVTGQLLLMIEPSLLSGEAEMGEYERFIEEGNTLIVFKRNLEGMFGIRTTYGITNEKVVTVEGEPGEQNQASMFSETRILPDSQNEVLLHDDLGTVAIKRHIGKGSLIAVNSPDWLTNRYILEEDNLSLVFQLLEEENWDKVYVDEYTHKQGTTHGSLEVYPMWLLVAAFQLVLLTLFWLLYKGKRYGPIWMAREEHVRFSDEHITALAAWYQKGKLYQDSLAVQADYLRMIFQDKWGISYQKDWKDLKDLLTAKLPFVKEKDIVLFLEGIVSVLRKPNLSKQEYIKWSKQIDRYRKEVEEG